MRLCLLAMTMVALSAPPLAAGPNVRFPYQATVEAEETFVRSGPGSKYYPTSKLKAGETVVVHRHDPGGWYMIAPPPGSFSWVPARYVKKVAPDRGVITTNHVAVRVGSFESDIRELFQRKLAEGDEVQILGEKPLAPETGTGTAEVWYRIAPPRGEWRWIAGQALGLVPANGPVANGAADVDSSSASRDRASSARNAAPRESEPSGTRPDARSYLSNDLLPRTSSSGNGDQSQLVDRPLVRRGGQGGQGGTPVPAKPQGLDVYLEELDRLDARFRSILDQPTHEWDFTQLEDDYRRLKEKVETSSVQRMIDSRLTHIDDYRRAKTEDEELARATQETLRRDAELAERQRQLEARLTTQRSVKYDGAGIVGRAALTGRGAPQYVLLAPSGKVLAYLAAGKGVNLELWLGRSVGVNGQRVPHPTLKADLITVERLTLVRLAP
ncbi:MAG: SH3 domain-containing protein [Planctomycetales bacterium]